MCLCVFLLICVCIMCVQCVWRQKRALDPLQLELHMVLNHLMDSGNQIWATAEPSLQHSRFRVFLFSRLNNTPLWECVLTHTIYSFSFYQLRDIRWVSPVGLLNKACSECGGADTTPWHLLVSSGQPPAIRSAVWSIRAEGPSEEPPHCSPAIADRVKGSFLPLHLACTCLCL